MRVKAIRDHYADGAYRTAGEEFEHSGKLHEHLEPVNKADREKWAKAKAKDNPAKPAAEPAEPGAEEPAEPGAEE
jgi:hypothetical protein